MSATENGVKEWLSQNRQAMILCPYQPGSLIISKNACRQRHLLARVKKERVFSKDDFFGYIFRKGLSLCRPCHIGKKLARSPRKR